MSEKTRKKEVQARTSESPEQIGTLKNSEAAIAGFSKRPRTEYQFSMPGPVRFALDLEIDEVFAG